MQVESFRAGQLGYDVVLPVLEMLQYDYSNLYRCSLVNREFNEIASKILYSRVVLSLPFSRGLNLKDQDGLSDCGQFISSCLPRNAMHATRLEISGFMSTRPPPRNTIGTQILHAVQCYNNLHAVQISPVTYPSGIFTDVLRALRTRQSLHDLTVNSACTDETGASALVMINGLQHLALIDPTRAILNLLPDWLSRLSGSLTELHLKNNCGSITPAILRSFIPHLRPCVRSVSLGLSYSLTDDDVFAFLNELPELTSVELQYYLQLKLPVTALNLPHMRSFTARYAQPHTRDEADHFCAWVRRTISSSHHLCILHLIGDNAKSNPSVSFDGLINHLTARHFRTLRVLDLGSAFIGRDAFKQLCTTCAVLEDLSVGVGWPTLLDFGTRGYTSVPCLHTVSFNIKNAKRRKVNLSIQQVTNMMVQGPPQLRRLVVNGVQWEGSWGSTSELEVKFVARDRTTQNARP